MIDPLSMSLDQLIEIKNSDKQKGYSQYFIPSLMTQEDNTGREPPPRGGSKSSKVFHAARSGGKQQFSDRQTNLKPKTSFLSRDGDDEVGQIITSRYFYFLDDDLFLLKVLELDQLVQLQSLYIDR